MALTTGLTALAVYLSTLCRGLWWFDSAELVNCAVLLDIPHPPGYPLLSILAALAVRVGPGPLPARVNAVSALAGAAAVGMLFILARSLGQGRAVSLAACLLFAVAPTFWDVSTVAEVYSLEALLLTGTLVWFVRVRDGDGHPLALGLWMGSLVAHRITNGLGVLGLLWLLSGRLARLEGGRALVGRGLALAAIPYLWTAWLFFVGVDRPPGQPWSLVWFDFPRTVATFLGVVTATVYAGHLGPLGPDALTVEVLAWLVWARSQVGVVGLAIALFAAIRPPGPLRFLGWVLWPNLVFYLHYSALEKDTMYLPGLLVLVLWLTAAIGARAPATCRVAMALVLAPPLFCLGHTWSSVDKSSYRGVERAVANAAWLLPEGAHLYLTDDLVIHAFLYHRTVEGGRPDVTVTIVDDFTPAIAAGIRDALAGGRSVYSPLFYPGARFASVRQEFTIVPESFLYRIHERPESLPAVTGPRLDLGHGLRIVGLRAAGESPDPTEGQLVRVRISWGGVVARGHRLASRGAGSEGPVVVLEWAGPTPGVGVSRVGSPGRADPSVQTRGRHRAIAVGHQGRPTADLAGEPDGVMTEDYVVKVPSGARGMPRLWVLPSHTRALHAGLLRPVATASWAEGQFYRGMEAAFVRCIEEGAPAHGTVLELAAADDRLRAMAASAPIRLGR